MPERPTDQLPDDVAAAAYRSSTCAMCQGTKGIGFALCNPCFEKHVVEEGKWNWTDAVLARLALQAQCAPEEEIN